MRNLKKILCLALVLSMVLAVVSGAAYTNYADDAELTMVNEDYLLAAQLLQDIGVVVGVNNPEDGKTYYYPDNLLTRAELARVLYVLYSGSTDGAVYDPDLFRDELSTTFTDISGHWAEGYIKYGQAMGYLNGKSASIFDPDANVKAQEMATALLIVLGYKAADLAPNNPVNVIKYGYTNDKGNLFTTGLSTAAGAGGTHGMHVVGHGATTAIIVENNGEIDREGELRLEHELTREEAFYMMFKAIAKRNMVSKKLTIGRDEVNVDGQYYTNTGVKYVNYKFNVGYVELTDVRSIVSGSTDYAFNGKYGDVGIVRIETDALGAPATQLKAKDFGYTAKMTESAGPIQGIGYLLSATDWNKQIGRGIVCNLDYWNGTFHMTRYAFAHDVGRVTEKRGFAGNDVVVSKSKKVEVVGNYIKIDGTIYAPFFADGYRWMVNNSVGEVLTARELAAKLESEVGGGDEIVLKIAGGLLYGIMEEENFYATVTDVKKEKVVLKDADGKDLPEAEIEVAELTFMDGDKITLTNTYGFAKGDRIYGHFNLKGKDADTAAIAAEAAKTIAYRYDALPLEYVKVAATAVENIVVDTKDGANTKYFIEKADGTEFKLGAASDVATLKDGNYTALDGTMFVPAETSYWALYIVDGYCYEAEKVATEASKDLTVTAVKKDVNTANNTVTYVFTLNTKADGTGDAYTFTKTDATNKLAQYDNIATGDLVKYTYDTKTKAAKDIIEINLIEVDAEVLYNAAEFNNVDTAVIPVADALAAVGSVTNKNVENRIVFESEIVFGAASAEADLAYAIAYLRDLGMKIEITNYRYVVDAPAAE